MQGRLSDIKRPTTTLLLTALVLALALSAPAPAAAKDGKELARADQHLRNGDFEEAEKTYRSMLAKKPHDNVLRLRLSLALLKQRKNRDAYDHAARVVSAEPLSARAHALLGAALLGGGDFRLSVEEFRTALSLKDDDPIAVAGLALVDFYENRLAASLAGFRRASFLDPNEPDYPFHLGQVAARSERYAEAANAYEQFLRVAPRTDEERRARIRGLVDFLRYLGKQGSLMDVSGASRVAIPFELVNNRPVIGVRINNSREVFRFVIDSGAGMSVISTETARRLGLRPVARGGQARAVGGRFDIVYGFLNTVHLGEARADRVPVYVREFFSGQETVDGYVGLTLLSKFLTTVDYGAKTMTMVRDATLAPLDPASQPQSAKLFELPIRTTASGFWSGEVRLPGTDRSANFIMDTGATTSVVSEALAEREGMERFFENVRLRVYGAAGVTEGVQALTLPSLAIGPHQRRNVRAVVLDLSAINETAGFEQAGIVGGNVLRNFRVTFDFRRWAIRFELLDGAGEQDSPDATQSVTSQS